MPIFDEFEEKEEARWSLEQRKLSDVFVAVAVVVALGSSSNDDGVGNEDVKKAIGLLRKTTTLHVHHDFLYISLPSLHAYDVKKVLWRT